MKRLLCLLITIMFLPVVVNAAGKATIAAPGSAENGANVKMTVTVSGVAAWNLTLSGSGATSGCTQKVADVTADAKNTNQTFSVTCKATKEGTITFAVTGDITSADGTNTPVSLSKSVTIVKARERDTNNDLKDLSIKGQELEFKKDTLEYTITVDALVETLEVTASAASSKAKVSVDSPEYLVFGENTIKVIVTSESGSKKEYTIKVIKSKPALECEKCEKCPSQSDECPSCEASNSKGMTITLVVETVLLIGIGGYVLYDKKFRK